MGMGRKETTLALALDLSRIGCHLHRVCIVSRGTCTLFVAVPSASAVMQDMGVSQDGQCIALETGKGTMHVFVIKP